MSTEQLAARIVAAMDARRYALDRGAGQVSIIYIEGVTFSDVNGVLTSSPNGNKPNLWNDVRIVLQFAGGVPVITNWWPATTEPGNRYTLTPVAGAVAEGAARITLGQQRCWQVGLHRGYEALAQTGDVVMVTRDKNKDFSRLNDKVTKGFYGINQHHGFDAPVNDIGPHSAGCLVGRTKKGHLEFMALIKTDPRYIANHKFVYATTILEAADIAGEASAGLPPSRPTSTAPAKMILKLTPEAVRKCFPGCPEAIVSAFVTWQGDLAKAGILDTPQRAAYCFANLSHETRNFTTPGLVENIHYTAARAAQVWPNRFPGGASSVVAKYGSASGWQEKMMDDVYGNRMGNRTGTNDGSKFIGRAGPQITGRDGYREVGERAGLDLENHPELASRPENQPAIAAAFWSWKGLNALADRGDFLSVVKLWNGGTNGLAERQSALARIRPVVDKLDRVPWSPEAKAASAVVVVGAAATAHEASKPNSGWGPTVAIGVAVVIVAVIAVVLIRSFRKQSPEATQ